ncbi:hypothetical protein [Actinophytocola sp.]|uniref:hypothetical protein n=1 Tax=Actinophytocola sp. TaxID=1872138 RepID=UPI002D803FA8|nr:hypothetical protein [Actinophytocola sp.]HET9140312.1 hypothetical protein [Actinophytocola sp.]
MTDLRVLADAFTELERRADAATGTPHATVPAPRAAARLVPFAAAAAVVVGIAAGVGVLAPAFDSGSQTMAPPSTRATTPARTEGPDVRELTDRFRAALGDRATFTVTESGPGLGTKIEPHDVSTGATPPEVRIGASIRGTLTAGGVTGGFDLTGYPMAMGGTSWTGDFEEHTLPDGTRVVSGEFSARGPAGGLNRYVQTYRPDGNSFILVVSNQRSPHGNTELLGPHPPLTLDQMVAVLTDRW